MSETSVTEYGLTQRNKYTLRQRAAVLDKHYMVKRIPVDNLVALDDRVVRSLVGEYIENAEWQRKIDVVGVGGEYFILDGHHRAAAASAVGKNKILARVYPTPRKT